MSVTFTPSPELYPFESRWFESSRGRMHYVDEGQGRPIVMFHGNPTWSFVYRDVIRLLRDRFRCVAVDYLGFGLSERPRDYGYSAAEHAAVVSELVGHLGLSDLIVMGHDWGGPIGLSVATSDPERVSGLVLGNTWFWPASFRFRAFSRVMSSPPLQRAIRNRNLFVERFVPSGMNRQLTPEEMEHYRAVQPTPEARVGVAELPRQIIRARPLLERLAASVPRDLGGKRVLIAFPMQDTAFRPKEVLPRMRGAFRDAQVIELPNAKHFFSEDAPDELAAAIADRFGPGV